jgi:hypothetical protein
MIKIVRGDTKRLCFQRIDPEGNPILEKASKIYFTVKKSNYAKEPLFQKTIDDMEFDEEGIYHFTIETDDTSEITYGNYVFDIEVKEFNYTQTIAQGAFIIAKEVTFKENEV